MNLLTYPRVSSVTGFLVDFGSSSIAAPIWGCVDDGHAEWERHGSWCVGSAIPTAFRIEPVATVGVDGVDDCHLVVVGAAELSTLCEGR